VGKTNAATTPWNLTADVFTFVPDTRKPVITTPLPDLTLEATGPAGAAATYAAEAADVKDGILPVTFAPPSGSVFPLGTTAVTATATDFHGNVATVSFDVTVVDTTPPVLSLPPNVTITTCERPNIGQAAATDLASTPVVTNDAPALFGLGVTLVTWRAVDPSGNVATGAQRVTVELGDDAKCCPAGTKVIVGTNASNVILGTAGSDCIVGLGGNDVINALGGDDFISGGAGNDTIAAGLGNDLIMAGPGDDIVDASVGNDTVRGGSGRDTIAAGPGSDDVDGGTETDVCAVPPDGTDVVVRCP
jgi:Ca2+-binding RTX toxin-like protein